MTDAKKIAACTERSRVIKPQDLPLSCPADDMLLWNAHPKVYLPIEDTGLEVCPYCGTSYVLQQEE